MSDGTTDSDRDFDAASPGRMPLFHGIRAYVNQLRYPSALSSLYHGRFLYNQSYGLAVDADALEVCYRNPVFRQCADARIKGVTSVNWSIEPGDESEAAKRYAHIVEEALGQIRSFYEGQWKIAKCVLVGTSYTFIESARKQLTLGGIPGLWWVPTFLKDMDYRRMRWVSDMVPDEDGNHRPHVMLEMRRAAGFGDEWDVVPEGSPIIRAVYNDEESRLGSGRGLIDSAISSVWAIEELKQLGHEGAALWARGGIVKAAVNSLTRESAVATSQAIVTWQQAIVAMLKDGTLVHDAADDFSVIPGGSEGSNIVSRLVEMHEDNLRTLFTNSRLPVGGGGEVGSLARATEEGDQSEGSYQSDRAVIADIITRDLIGPFIRYNRPRLAALGFDSVPPPKFSTVQERKEDHDKFVQRTAQILTIPGVRLSLGDVLERAGYPTPKADEDTIGTPEAPPPGAGFDAMPPDGAPMIHRRGAQAHKAIAAGLAVMARDTGRVLMLQRALADDDDAAGTWEFPGGHIESGEAPLAAAKREWSEETRCELPRGKVVSRWDATNGKYKGFVLVVPTEKDVPIHGDRDDVSNPDDPDGDLIESLAWWDADHLADNPALRKELAADIEEVREAIQSGVAGKARHARAFREEDHPRADDGKFGSGGGSAKAEPADDTETPELTMPGADLTPAGRTLAARVTPAALAAAKVASKALNLVVPKEAQQVVGAVWAAVNAAPKISAAVLRETGLRESTVKRIEAFLTVADYFTPGPVFNTAALLVAAVATGGKAPLRAGIKGVAALRQKWADHKARRARIAEKIAAPSRTE